MITYKSSPALTLPPARAMVARTPVPPARGRRMRLEELDGVVVARLAGDDTAQLWKALEPLFAAGRRAVVVDLGEVAFLNSVAIAALIAVRRRAVAQGGRLALAGLRPQLQAVFRVLKLERLFDLGLDLEQARRAVR